MTFEGQGRLLIAALAVAALTLAACGGQPAALQLEDGTHEGASDADGSGYVRLQLTVENGEITDVDWQEFRGDGGEKTTDDYTYDAWLEAAEELPARLLEAQSADIDGVAGATGTSDKFKQAARRALDEEPDEVGPFTDGEHEGFSDPDAHGFVRVKLLVQRGSVTDVQLQEFQADGTEKDEDYHYDVWQEAKDQLPKRVIQQQSTDIDAVAGATSTSEKFIQAVRRALQEEDPYEAGQYVDGVFQAQSDPGDRGGYVELEVTVVLGRVVDVQFEEYQDDGEAKDPDDYHHEAWIQAHERLPEQVIDQQNADIDAVAGATQTSEMFQQALQRALEEASP